MQPRFIFIIILGGFMLAACGNRVQAVPKSVTPPQTYVYECEEGYRFPARIEAGKAWLFMPGQTVSLPHVRAASGAKYSNGKVVFWSKGEKALLDNGDGVHRNCLNNRAAAVWEHAKLNGVDFRAVGNEPGWHLEISKGRKIIFVSDYGQSRYGFDTPEPETDRRERTSTYRAQNDTHALEVVISGQPCRDTMRGDAFESTVTVTLNGRTFGGCGKALH